MRILTTGLGIFLSTLGVYVFCLNGIWAADHPTALLELSYALWTNHSIVLAKVGQQLAGTVDVFPYKGNYYSALAPGVSFLALPFVGPGFVLDGKFNQFANALLLSELFVSVCNCAAAYLVFKLGSMYFARRTAAFVAFAYAFSTISWAYATFFFEADLSAALDVSAVYLAIRIARRGSAGTWEHILCGVALGTALTVDYLNVLFVPVVALFLVSSLWGKRHDLTKALAGLLGFSAVGGLLLGLYDQVAFGSPFVTTEQAYQHSSSLLGAFSYPILAGLYVDLFSPMRGIFVYCPFLVLGVVGFYSMSKRHALSKEAVLLGACFVATLIPYSMWYNVAGGEGFGQRFLIPVIPFLLIPSGFAIESGKRGAVAFAYALYAVGVFINAIGAITDAIVQVQAFSQSLFFDQVLPQFLNGTLETWWWRETGAYWWVPSILIIAAALVLPLVALKSGENDGAARADPPPSKSS
jgi:hypothetical protein